MKTLYLDIFSGISGDMFLGAMLDLGVDAKKLERELAKLGLDGYHLHIHRKQVSGIEGVKFDVHLEEEPHHHDHDDHHGHAHEHDDHHEHGHHHHEDEEHEHHHEEAPSHHGHGAHIHGHHGHTHEHHEHEHTHGRNYADISRMIKNSRLSAWVKEKSLSVFERVAVAEGKIHGKKPDHVHFHEVGAVDSIVDIVGACIALELLGKPRVWAAPVVEGTGWVNCAHGRFPVPTAATLEILGARGIALTQCEEPHELVTPTGAAILAEFAEAFLPMTQLVASQVGYGLGTRQNKTRPNVLRAVLGDAPAAKPAPAAPSSGALDWETDTVAVLETNLDNINAEILGHFMDLALAQGALEVFHTGIMMKKNRPGVMLTVLCAEPQADRFAELILRETTALGVRRYVCERRKLKREFCAVATSFGEIEVKTGWLGGKVIQATPEFESCKKAAAAAGVPVKQVYAEAMRKFQPKKK